MRVRILIRTGPGKSAGRNRNPGFTLTELMVGLGVGSLVLAAVAALTVYGARAFASIGNYADLDARSRNTFDVLGSKVRAASSVLACETNLPVKSLKLACPDPDHTITLTWDSDARTFVLDETGQVTRTLLTECDALDFALYTRAPNVGPTNVAFIPASTLADCRVISLSWRCSRTMPGNKLNTESVQTAQLVLRNLP
jgi:prepilin-type N-terminal cleavage/methylation domain-containing protein